MAELPKNFLKFSQRLNEYKVKYLIVGGYAVIYHGYPRSTVDFDVLIAMNEENVKRLRNAVVRLGFDPKEFPPEFLLTPSSVIMIGCAPWRIDILTSIKGLDFQKAYENRVSFDVCGIQLPFISKADLILSKKASARYRDRDDLKRLGA